MKALKWAAIFTLLAALTHFAIIIGGPEWYRFFGAGEEMARMSEQGHAYPAVATGVIAVVLFAWSLYGFSGAGIIRRLPLLKTALLLIALVFLARGVFMIPALYWVDSPYLAELKSRMTFMWISSFICLVIGSLYAFGLYYLWRKHSYGR